MASLCPSIKFTAWDDDGLPLAGGKVYFYAAGTSTPKDTWTTSAASVANPNPVILDARGEATVWMTGAYKVILKTSADVTIYTEDNVSDGTLNGTFTNATFDGTLTIESTAIDYPNNVTHNNTQTFSGTVNLNGPATNIGNSAGDALTIAPNAITLSNNPTISGSPTFQDNLIVGTADTDTLSVNSTATFTLAATTHTFGLKVGNTSRADTSTLDYYLEGSFTPTVSGSSTAGAATYVLRNGVYTRIGNLVFFELIVSWTAHTGTGNILISGLPYASSGSSERPFSVTVDNLAFTGQLCAQIATGLSTTIALYTIATGAARASVAMDTAVSGLFISGFYSA